MSHRRVYEIAFVGLKPGIHHFEYSINNKFFESYGEQEFSNCTATVKLQLEKNTGFMMLKFDVGGQLEVSCDRCGNPLPLQLWDEFKLLVKMVEEPEVMNEQEEDPDVYYISRGESHLRVADWIYEFINLSLPMQKMCPEEKIGSDYCNKEALEMLKKIGNPSLTTDNAIWKGLEKIKKNLDN